MKGLEPGAKLGGERPIVGGDKPREAGSRDPEGGPERLREESVNSICEHYGIHLRGPRVRIINLLTAVSSVLSQTVWADQGP